MENKEKQYRSIAQLWDELQSLVTAGRFTNMDGEEDAYTDDVNAKRQFLKSSLRAELLERCGQSIIDGDGDDSTFDIYTEKAENPQTFVRSRHGIRFDTPETARNMSAAFAFWAWELEQRENETQNGDDQ